MAGAWDGEQRPYPNGAIITFFGTVRGIEASTKIRGIEYSAYPPMAEAEMARLDGEGRERFGNHPLYIHHTLGIVPQGDPSVVIRVALPHSAEAFDACQWYLGMLKTRIPIWKRPLPQ